MRLSQKIIQKMLSAVICLLVISTSQTISAETICPTGCTCNQTHAKCTTLAGLIDLNETVNFETLDLSNNSFRKLTSHLDKFSNLHSVDLSNNRLSEVNKLPKGIKDLNLSGNRITSAKLSKIPKSVESLNISHNHITYVPHSIMTLKNLRSIDLSGNPINCTCDTLAVRNWLSHQNVWSSVVTCSNPLKFKGMPWLQVKQADVCEVKIAPTRWTDSKKSKYNFDDLEDNELMQGDQPAADDYEEGSGDSDKILSEEDNYPNGDEDSKEDVPDPEDDYDNEDEGEGSVKPAAKDEVDAEAQEEGLLPVHAMSSTIDPVTDDDSVEGSGTEAIEEPIVKAYVPPLHEEASAENGTSPSPVSDDVTDEYDEYEDGSGTVNSTKIPPLHFPSTAEPSTTQSDLYYEEPEMTTLPELNIFGVGIESTSESSVEDRDELLRVHIPIEEDSTGDVITTGPLDDSEEKQKILEAKADNNQKTYILLGILGVLLLGLIIYVALKDKSSKRNRRNKNRDVEKGPATELKDMDKNLLGKEKNGNHQPPKAEHSPLINNRDEKPPNGHGSFPAVSPNKLDDLDHPDTAHPPLTTFKPIIEEPSNHDLLNNNNTEPQQNGTIPEVHKPVEPPVDQPKRYSPVYTPRTPKLPDSKYSPVYSPETGRVKIKATETPRAKTPVLVTRTKSSAGDYITTPEVH